MRSVLVQIDQLLDLGEFVFCLLLAVNPKAVDLYETD